MLTHKCLGCGFKTNLFRKWVDHLWQERHQDVVRSSFMEWSEEANGRSMLLYSTTPPHPLASEVLQMCLDLGMVPVNLVWWPSCPRNVIVQLESREDVDKVMKIWKEQPDRLTFKENALGLRRKSEVHDFEWYSIIGAAAVCGSSENPLVVDSDSTSDDGGLGDEKVV